MLSPGQVVDVGDPQPVGKHSSPPGMPQQRRPRLSGDLAGMVGTGPVFRAAVRGYDRLEVDNYVAWAEGELATAQREREHLLDRVVACAADLAISRRLLAERPAARALVSDRVAEVLRLAEEQAGQVLDAADAEAARVVADARLEADARLRKAREIKEMAADAADDLRAVAQQDRAEAAALLDHAASRAEDLLREAREECERLAAEAREERERLAAEAREERDRLAAEAARERERLAAEVADLQRQRDTARAVLRGLTDRVGEALLAVGVSDSEHPVLAGGGPETATACPGPRTGAGGARR